MCKFFSQWINHRDQTVSGRSQDIVSNITGLHVNCVQHYVNMDAEHVRKHPQSCARYFDGKACSELKKIDVADKMFGDLKKVLLKPISEQEVILLDGGTEEIVQTNWRCCNDLKRRSKPMKSLMTNLNETVNFSSLKSGMVIDSDTLAMLLEQARQMGVQPQEELVIE